MMLDILIKTAMAELYLHLYGSIFLIKQHSSLLRFKHEC